MTEAVLSVAAGLLLIDIASAQVNGILAMQDLFHWRHPATGKASRLSLSVRKLVHSTLGVRLSKAEQISNWGQRPLSAKQRNYVGRPAAFWRLKFMGFLMCNPYMAGIIPREPITLLRSPAAFPLWVSLLTPSFLTLLFSGAPILAGSLGLLPDAD